MKKKLLFAAKCLLFVLPFLMGTVGFIIQGDTSPQDALFLTLTMYVMNYGDTPGNILVELARWLAPLATASGVIMAVSYVKDSISNYFLYRSGKSVAVYGSGADGSIILSQLGKYGIDGKDRFVNAQRYILAYDENENIKFYYNNKNKLNGKRVYLKCDTIRSQMTIDDEITLYSIEEIAARLFWKRSCIYKLSESKAHKLDIVMIGFGRLGEELLYHGLLNNIFSPRQEITYHIFGDCEDFLAVHTELGEIGDKVIMHGEKWYDGRELIEKADMVLLVEQSGQIQLINEINILLPNKEITVFLAEPFFEGILSGYDHLTLTDWRSAANHIDYIMDDKLMRLAKLINLKYASIYSEVEFNNDDLETQWRMLDTFTKYSNISAADYHEIRLQMMKNMGLSEKYEDIPEDKIEYLANLEHLRWCRYHILNNWRYGVPENGKRKDAAARVHMDLIAYDELSSEEKEKDRSNIRLLLEIQNERSD